jgi:DNA-binding transcriptional MerR regulator
MSEIRYIISDASKRVDVEPHVLRYWEEELNLDIPRNEMGHRYYMEDHIEMLKTIKILKEQGFQLKAIKMLLPDINKIETLDPQSILKLKEELNEKAGFMEEETSMLETKEVSSPGDKMEQFQVIMNNIITNALRDNNRDLSETISGSVSDSVIKEMDYLMRLKEEREEERFKKLDETIRNAQRTRQDIAATEIKVQNKKINKKKRLFQNK